VIGRAVNDEGSTAHLAYDAAQVGEKIVADFGSNERAAILGAEDQVKEEIAGGVGHVSFAPSELAEVLAAYPRLAP
jgi:hypothetical protein